MHAPNVRGSAAISRRTTLSRFGVVVDSNANERFDNTLNASSPTTALRQVHRECGQMIGTDLWPVNKKIERKTQIGTIRQRPPILAMTDQLDRGIAH